MMCHLNNSHRNGTHLSSQFALLSGSEKTLL